MKKKQRNEVVIEGIKAVKELGVAFFEAAAVNPIMATAGGLLPYTLISMINPLIGMTGLIGVGAVAGLQSTPSLAVSTPLISFGVSSVAAQWPAQINIIKKDQSLGTGKEQEELGLLLKALGLKALP